MSRAAYHKEHYQKYADYYKAKARRHYHANKKEVQGYYLIKKYNMPMAEYEALLQTQDFGCAICKTKALPDKSLAVDRCHTTGNNRGLLCDSCNNGIGRFKDNPDLLIEAANYLKRYINASS